MRVSKIKTWTDNWNDVIRLLYKDPYLKELMCLPSSCSIVQFIEKYFVKGVSADEIVTDEKVRILWYDSIGSATNNKNVRLKFKEFDIFVKDDVLHNATGDRLQYRYNLICDRLKDILLRLDAICGLRFSYVTEYDMWTKTIGYSRYHIVFSYKTTI